MINKASKTPSKKLQKLQDFTSNSKNSFYSSHKRASDWLEKKSLKVADMRAKSQNFLAAASLTGSVVAGSSVDAQVLQKIQNQDKSSKDLAIDISKEEYEVVLDKAKAFSMMNSGHLAQEDELYLEQQLSDMLGFEVTAELDGHRLNHSVGIMGGEQHLRRFDGDSLDQHDAYRESGMAPARGAFGWFAQGELDEKTINREKYYFAVQTLYLPDWNTNYRELKPWYKFRKMIAINPANELAVVGVVGDAGPALWVKKQFGGSPEVIREAKIWSPEARGRVILLFVDDPEDKIPLGVINLKSLIQTQV
ncbi:MAG: hypothetical protein ABFQ62_04725 [Patescibacteria group bacterium]